MGSGRDGLAQEQDAAEVHVQAPEMVSRDERVRRVAPCTQMQHQEREESLQNVQIQ